MDNIIDLDIVSPDRKVYSGKIKSVSAPGITGGFQVLPNHAPYVTTLGTGKVKVIEESGKEEIYAVSGGIFEVKGNKASLLAESIESQQELDIERVKAALARAEDRLKSKDDGIDRQRVKVSIEKAKNRLKVAEEK